MGGHPWWRDGLRFSYAPDWYQFWISLYSQQSSWTTSFLRCFPRNYLDRASHWTDRSWGRPLTPGLWHWTKATESRADHCSAPRKIANTYRFDRCCYFCHVLPIDPNGSLKELYSVPLLKCWCQRVTYETRIVSLSCWWLLTCTSTFSWLRTETLAPTAGQGSSAYSWSCWRKPDPSFTPGLGKGRSPYGWKPRSVVLKSQWSECFLMINLMSRERSVAKLHWRMGRSSRLNDLFVDLQKKTAHSFCSIDSNKPSLSSKNPHLLATRMGWIPLAYSLPPQYPCRHSSANGARLINTPPQTPPPSSNQCWLQSTSIQALDFNWGRMSGFDDRMTNAEELERTLWYCH